MGRVIRHKIFIPFEILIYNVNPGSFLDRKISPNFAVSVPGVLRVATFLDFEANLLLTVVIEMILVLPMVFWRSDSDAYVSVILCVIM